MNRVLFSDNGTISDITTSLLKFDAGTNAFTYTTSEDYIYIGSMHPFNGYYFHPSVTNATPVTVTVEVWDGSDWKAAVNVVDETSSFGQAGYITFTPDQSKLWTREDTVDINGNVRITALSSVSIYDLFWARFSFDQTISFTLKYIGHKFSNDTDLYVEYPEFNNSTLQGAVASGKTDWDSQSIRASQLLIEDMISQGIISYGEQLLDRRKFMSVGVTKTAEIIYNLLGRDYAEEYSKARLETEKRILKGNYSVDYNKNAKLDVSESTIRTGMLYR